MKKTLAICAILSLGLALTGCKSKESAYKKAYEKAKAQEQTQPVEAPATPVVTPVETPANQAPVYDNVDNATVREESVTMISGSGLKNFSVVVGSFSLKANAEGLYNNLKSGGYDAQIVFNSERNMYRVIASTFDDKASAVGSRSQLRANYPDAWLLYKK